MFSTYKKLSLLFCGAALFALPLAALAQNAKPDAAPTAKPADAAPPVSWSLQHKKGAKNQFRGQAHLVGKTDAGAISLVVKTIQRREISKVEDTGALTWFSTELSRATTFNEQEISETAKRPVTMTVTNASGLVTDLKSDIDVQGGDTIIQISGVIIATPVPPKPVKVGDSWDAQYDGALYKGKKFTVTYTYLGRETTFGINAYKLQAKGDLPLNTSATDFAKLTGTLYIDPASGDAIRAVYNISNLDLNAAGSSLKVTLDSETTQIIPGVNDKKEVKK